METKNRIVVISRNGLQKFALRSVCHEHLMVSGLLEYDTVADFMEAEEFADLLFVDSHTWVQHTAALQSQSEKVVVLVEDIPTKPKVHIHESHMVIPLSTNYHELGNFLKKYWQKDDVERKTKEEKVLSQREEEVLGLVCKGKSNKEIAEELFISSHTVISHRKNICAKLKIKSVPALTIYAVLNGIISRTEFE